MKMRMLFSCLPGYGSLHPPLHLALASQNAGHEVAFATGGVRRSTLENLGLSLYAVGSRFRGFLSVAEMVGVRVFMVPS